MLDGMAKVDMLAAEVKRQGMPAVGITDHGNMFGSDAFYQKMVAEGIKPIIGIEAYLAPESRFNKNRIRWGEPHQKSDDVSASGAYLHQNHDRGDRDWIAESVLPFFYGVIRGAVG